jgi:hypothetical protein
MFRSILLFSSAAFSISPASAAALDWSRVFALIPESMRNSSATPSLNSTARTGKVQCCSGWSGSPSTSCTKAGAITSSFKASIVPIAPKDGEEFITTFDYVSSPSAQVNLCWAQCAGADTRQ